MAKSNRPDLESFVEQARTEMHQMDGGLAQDLGLMIEDLAAYAIDLEAENSRLRAGLHEYGRHKRDCKGIVYYGLNQTEGGYEGPCSCGFDATSGPWGSQEHGRG